LGIASRLGHRQRSHEIAEVVGEHMELKTDGVGGEGTARQPGPLDRALALLETATQGSDFKHTILLAQVFQHHLR
jgi:hypothetical protein